MHFVYYLLASFAAALVIRFQGLLETEGTIGLGTGSRDWSPIGSENGFRLGLRGTVGSIKVDTFSFVSG